MLYQVMMKEFRSTWLHEVVANLRQSKSTFCECDYPPVLLVY